MMTRPTWESLPRARDLVDRQGGAQGAVDAARFRLRGQRRGREHPVVPCSVAAPARVAIDSSPWRNMARNPSGYNEVFFEVLAPAGDAEDHAAGGRVGIEIARVGEARSQLVLFYDVADSIPVGIARGVELPAFQVEVGCGRTIHMEAEHALALLLGEHRPVGLGDGRPAAEGSYLTMLFQSFFRCRWH